MLLVSCKSNGQSSPIETRGAEIGQYVVAMLEDSRGHYWFGTLSKGVARYDGEALSYLTIDDGLPSNRVTDIWEDSEGVFWFATGEGLSKYDGKQFVNYSESEGLCSDRMSMFFLDSRDLLWIGTWDGVCTFDGEQFVDFPLPKPEVDGPINKDTEGWITHISEDASGNIWFGRDGYGACRYDGQSFRHLSRKDGMLSNNVQSIVQGDDGYLWISTRVAEKDNPDPTRRSGKGGLSKYDGEKFIHFPDIEGLTNSDVYSIYKCHNGDLLISTISNGFYRYDGSAFHNYEVPITVSNMMEDSKGNIWLGCSGGLYQLNKHGHIRHISVDGPWD